MEQQASHIDENGNFLLISSLHRSIVANKMEVMRKLQKKVNQVSKILTYLILNQKEHQDIKIKYSLMENHMILMEMNKQIMKNIFF